MSQSKDFIKFRQYLRALSLSVNEQYLMELFFEYNNSQFGYSFLEFTDIMAAFNTTSKNRISTTIKKLEKRGLIVVDRSHKNNRYKIIEIDNFINTLHKKENKNKPVDSNGVAPMEGQVHIAELLEEKNDITEEESKIIDLGFTYKQAKKLLVAAKDKVEKIVEAFEYAASKGASNLYAYTLWTINNLKKTDCYSSKDKTLKFNNFEPREYDYDNLEKKLLGWQKNNSEEESKFDLKSMLLAI